MTAQPPCAVDTCHTEPAILRPVPLCTRHGIETALAVLPAALAGALVDASETSEDETTPEPVEPTDLERAAITGLRVAGMPIGRRQIEDAVRALGGRCRSTRANDLARWARQGSDIALFNRP